MSKDYDTAIKNGADEGEIWEMIRGYAYAIVRKYDPQEHEDLMQECFLAMHRALEKYKPGKGTSFPTYCAWMMRSYITKYRRKQSFLPQTLWERVQRVNRYTGYIYMTTGRTPDDAQICEELGMKQRDLDRVKIGTRAQYAVSIDETAAGTDGATIGDIIEDQADRIGGVEIDEDRRRLARETREALSSLTDRERDVLRMSYGLDGKEPLNGAQIGERLHISNQGVHETMKRAREKLEKGKYGEHFRAYFDNYLATHSVFKGTGLTAFKERGSVEERLVIDAMSRYGGEQTEETY